MAPFIYLSSAFVALAIATRPVAIAAPGHIRRQGEPDLYLNAHNAVRSEHGADDLVWENDAATAAQNWANACRFEHEPGSSYGENLAAGLTMSIEEAVQVWTDEASQYDPESPQGSYFTQLVWKSSTGLGCGHAICSGGVFGPAPQTFHVCKYNPPGNIDGEYEDNVQV